MDLEPFVGEVGIAVREEGNVHDRYAVAILCDLPVPAIGTFSRSFHTNTGIILIMCHIE